ncbi:MAG: bifunctional UDP-N-acetylglucosamine diphosphorylase/glucosamine-1-phosphate N-acetyltransferase GlmU [Anaerolineae bacterium]
MGKPLLTYILAAVQPVEPQLVAIVAGHEADQVKQSLEPSLQASGLSTQFVLQSPQLGTGHAVQQAQQILGDAFDNILVVPGDLPLLSADTMQQLVSAIRATNAPMVMLTAEVDNPRGFGRIVRNADGYVQAIVEEAICTAAQKAIRELNVGAYAFNARWLWNNLANIPLSPKGEYYITDLVEIAVSQGLNVVAEKLADPAEAIGVNTRIHLAEAEQAIRRRICHRWMAAGVTIVDPATTYIEAGVTLQPDTIIYPNTYLQGHTSIGQDCAIGPNTLIQNSVVGDSCVIRFSVVEDARLESEVDVGPFAHLRKGAHLATGVHMGNFGEVKNSYLGPYTKMGHFSYLGDATIGTNVNIGAGTITCNYDGANKNPTRIGDNAFIGSDTMLVAPVSIGQNARTGAGSVVTRDVPDDGLAYGVPARNNPTKHD